MKRYEVKEILSPDFFDEEEGHLLAFEDIPVQKNISIGVNIDIGPVGSEAADTFYTTIIAGEKFINKKNSSEIYVDIFNPIEIKEIIEKIVEECEGDNWETTKESLKRHFQYEYG